MKTIRLVKSNEKGYNADKTIHVYIDGEKQNWWLWNMGWETAYKTVKNRLGVKRAKKELVYA